MSEASFFAELTQATAATHAAGLNHPAVLGIGDGSLSDATFRYYIEQDYSYLRRYIQVLALAVAASPDLPTATNLAELVRSTLSIEVGALIDLYAAFDGDGAALDAVHRAPTCQAYTDHLIATARSSSLFVILASVLPCQWGYREIGRHLLRRGLPDDPRFARWIEEYASEEYSAFVDWAVGRFDELSMNESEQQRQAAREVFVLSTQYELAFWQMAWVREQWGSRSASTIQPCVP